jgi:hypothetical protein
MNQHYSEVIDVLMTQDINYKKIAIELAKKHPDIFMECLAQSTEFLGQKLTCTELAILDILKNPPSSTISPKIEAIKQYRIIANTNLKEAKDAVEAMQIKFESLGCLPAR